MPAIPKTLHMCHGSCFQYATARVMGTGWVRNSLSLGVCIHAYIRTCMHTCIQTYMHTRYLYVSLYKCMQTALCLYLAICSPLPASPFPLSLFLRKTCRCINSIEPTLQQRIDGDRATTEKSDDDSHGNVSMYTRPPETLNPKHVHKAARNPKP